MYLSYKTTETHEEKGDKNATGDGTCRQYAELLIGVSTVCAETSLRFFKNRGQVFVCITLDPPERGTLQLCCQPTDKTAVKEEAPLKEDELS